jgi:hypothetical protein
MTEMFEPKSRERFNAASVYDKAFARAEVYEPVVRYLVARGWRRQELGSGWWWKDGCKEEATLGGALEQQLDEDGIDQRNAIPYEPEEFWG